VFSFLLSFLYGAGGAFFLVLIASIFSTVFLYTFKTSGLFVGFSVLSFILMLFLLFPILLSSIAGGIISKAFIKEGIGSVYFKNVLIDGLIIFLIAIISLIALVYLWFLFVVLVY